MIFYEEKLYLKKVNYETEIRGHNAAILFNLNMNFCSIIIFGMPVLVLVSSQTLFYIMMYFDIMFYFTKEVVSMI